MLEVFQLINLYTCSHCKTHKGCTKQHFVKFYQTMFLEMKITVISCMQIQQNQTLHMFIGKNKDEMFGKVFHKIPRRELDDLGAVGADNI